MISGILNINKSAGPTSHDIVYKIRKVTGIKRVGHAGTLDPFAEGVLIILVGKTTKLQSKFMNMDKTYVGTLKLGEISDTYDKTGIKSKFQILNFKSILNIKIIKKILNTFIGEIEQTPPAFSAIKIKGERAYKLARKGIKPNLKPRKIKIYDIQCRKYKYPNLEIEVKCGKGTYIRSLANDVGKKLGCGAYLEKLTRTAIGKFNIKNATELNKLTPENWTKKLISVNL